MQQRPLEIVEVPFGETPRITEFRALFRKRVGRRAAPVLIVPPWRTAQATVCGPTEADPIEHLKLPVGQVEAVCRKAPRQGGGIWPSGSSTSSSHNRTRRSPASGTGVSSRCRCSSTKCWRTYTPPPPYIAGRAHKRDVHWPRCSLHPRGRTDDTPRAPHARRPHHRLRQKHGIGSRGGDSDQPPIAEVGGQSGFTLRTRSGKHGQLVHRATDRVSQFPSGRERQDRFPMRGR